MATLKELRLRVQSLKNTKKITSAMKMVSASKLKKAKDAFSQTQPFLDNTSVLLGRIINSEGEVDHPLLEKRECLKTRILLFSSDRGLCGSFNNSLFKYLHTSLETSEEGFDISTFGKKGYEYFSKLNISIHKNFEGFTSSPDFSDVNEISRRLIDDFISRKIDKVDLVYNKFISSLSQAPSTISLLPVSFINESETKEIKENYIFEPDKQTLLNELLPRYISNQIFSALLHNSIGEHAARMTAMDNATNNANDYINKLTVQMNRARQAAITTELIEIISGAESL